MRKETGVEYVHLLATDSHEPALLTYIDKGGSSHQLDLAPVSFYVQRRGESLISAMRRFQAAGDVSGAAAALRGLLEQYVQLSRRGLVDADSNYINNWGLIDGKPAILDVGNLMYDPAIHGPQENLPRLLKGMDAIERWVSTVFPELLPEYEKMLAPFKKRALEYAPSLYK